MATSAPPTLAFAIRGPSPGPTSGASASASAALQTSGGARSRLRRAVSSRTSVDAPRGCTSPLDGYGWRVRLRGAPSDLGRQVVFGTVRRPRGVTLVAGRRLRSSRGGRPNSGNSVSVSRKNVNSAIRPSCELEHLKRPRLVARRLGSACTGRTPASRSQPAPGSRASPGSRCPGPNHHVEDVVAAAAATASYGGIDWVASSWMSDGQSLHVVRSNAAT